MAADAALLRRFVSDCVSCIEVSGLSIRFGTDFQEFRRLVSRQPLRGQVAPIFDAGCGHVQRGNAFWVAVWDRAGELVATEALFLAAISHGAQACITGMANSLPHHLAKLYQAINNGDFEEARKLQLLTNKARTIIKRTPAIAGVYALMHYQGVDAGFPRLPFQKIGPIDILQEINELAGLGLLPKGDV